MRKRSSNGVCEGTSAKKVAVSCQDQQGAQRGAQIPKVPSTPEMETRRQQRWEMPPAQTTQMNHRPDTPMRPFTLNEEIRLMLNRAKRLTPESPYPAETVVDFGTSTIAAYCEAGRTLLDVQHLRKDLVRSDHLFNALLAIIPFRWEVKHKTYNIQYSCKFRALQNKMWTGPTVSCSIR